MKGIKLLEKIPYTTRNQVPKISDLDTKLRVVQFSCVPAKIIIYWYFKNNITLVIYSSDCAEKIDCNSATELCVMFFRTKPPTHTLPWEGGGRGKHIMLTW